MSSIETYLQYIANKVWARDVRTAIVNAIRQCYDDVHNPTLNTEALQAAIQAKIDAGQMAALTIGDRTITAAKLALGVIPTPDTTLSQSGVPADAKKTGDEITAINESLDNLDFDVDNAEFLSSNTLNLCDGEPINGYSLAGGTVASNEYLANANRYNLYRIPIEPNKQYTLIANATGTHTTFIKACSATKILVNHDIVDGGVAFMLNVTSGVKVTKTFYSGANDHYLYVFGLDYDAEERSHFLQVSEGELTDFTTDKYGNLYGTPNELLQIGIKDIKELAVKTVNLCDGTVVNGYSMGGQKASEQQYLAVNDRYNLYIVPIEPNKTYTVIAYANGQNISFLKVSTTTKLLTNGEYADGYSRYLTSGTKVVLPVISGPNDHYLYIYGLDYTSRVRNHFLQVSEGLLTDFTTDEYGGTGVDYGSISSNEKFPVRIVPISNTEFDVNVLDEATGKYLAHRFKHITQQETLSYGSGSTKTVVTQDVWYASYVIDQNGNQIMQGNTNFIHMVSNKGTEHGGHVGAGHGSCVATKQVFRLDGTTFNPASLAKPLFGYTFSFFEKVEHYLNDYTKSQALYPSSYSEHAVPTLDTNGDPILTGIEYLYGTWEKNNKVDIRNRFDIKIDDLSFSQLHGGMLCGFYPYFDNVIINSDEYLWTKTHSDDYSGGSDRTSTFTNEDMIGCGVVIPAGTVTNYSGDEVTLIGNNFVAKKRMYANNPARASKSNINMWMPPSGDARLKAYFMPCICTQSRSALDKGETVEVFNDGDIIDVQTELVIKVK